MTNGRAGTIFRYVPNIGRYEVGGEIGRGAMGVVYLARDPRVDRAVALKVLSVRTGLPAEQENEYRERFLREARAAGALSHPAIVAIHDAGEDPSTGVPFIVMEHVAGKSLRELLESDGPFEVQRACAVVETVAEALDCAHRSGIVHRDIKPANILVRGSDGAVKLADFGVARLPTSELTHTGAVVGSPAYMSPEQVRGEEAGTRSDLFSLAVILYELLCGDRPFHGDDASSLGYSIVHETPVPITKRVPGIPGGLGPFFDRALAKNAVARFPDAPAFRKALQEAVRKQTCVGADATVVQVAGPTCVTPKPRRFLRRPVVVVASFVILVLLWWILPFGGRDAHLQLDAKSSLEAGVFTLFVDGEEVYARDLAGPSVGGGILNKVLRKNQETFEAWIEVQSGKHEVTARVTSDEDGAEYTDTIVVDLEPDETKKIRMVAGRTLGTPLSLKID